MKLNKFETSILSLIVLLFVFSGCNNDKEDDSPSSNQQTHNDTTPEDTIPECSYLDQRLCDDPLFLGELFIAIDSTEANFDQYESKVLLENFTGFRCTNCLPANAQAYYIDSAFTFISDADIHLKQFVNFKKYLYSKVL